MAECIILWRSQNRRIGFVSDDDGELAIFPNREVAEDAARHTTVCKVFPYQIVEADEL